MSSFLIQKFLSGWHFSLCTNVGFLELLHIIMILKIQKDISTIFFRKYVIIMLCSPFQVKSIQVQQLTSRMSHKTLPRIF